MAKPELGTKRICPETGRRFYDLNQDPVISPYTGKVVPIDVPLVRGRPDAASRAAAAKQKEDAEAPETQEAEFVSLEDADEEASGGKKTTTDGDDDEDVEVADDAEDDSTFLEPDADEDEDVSDIIGGDREDEEET